MIATVEDVRDHEKSDRKARAAMVLARYFASNRGFQWDRLSWRGDSGMVSQASFVVEAWQTINVLSDDNLVSFPDLPGAPR